VHESAVDSNRVGSRLGTREQNHPATWSHLTIDPPVWNQHGSRRNHSFQGRQQANQSCPQSPLTNTPPCRWIAVRDVTATRAAVLQYTGGPSSLCRLFVNLARGSHWSEPVALLVLCMHMWIIHQYVSERDEIQISKRVSGGSKRERWAGESIAREPVISPSSPTRRWSLASPRRPARTFWQLERTQPGCVKIKKKFFDRARSLALLYVQRTWIHLYIYIVVLYCIDRWFLTLENTLYSFWRHRVRPSTSIAPSR
jgi:hypothetical protein